LDFRRIINELYLRPFSASVFQGNKDTGVRIYYFHEGMLIRGLKGEFPSEVVLKYNVESRTIYRDSSTEEWHFAKREDEAGFGAFRLLDPRFLLRYPSREVQEDKGGREILIDVTVRDFDEQFPPNQHSSFFIRLSLASNGRLMAISRSEDRYEENTENLVFSYRADIAHEIMNFLSDVPAEWQPDLEITRMQEWTDKASPKMLQVTRSSLQSLPNGKMVICPSKPDGIEFLTKHQAWGFVRIRQDKGEDLRYFALYVSKEVGAVKYFAEIERIVDARESRIPDFEDYTTYEPGKKVIELKDGSLRKLKDGIRRGEHYAFTRGRWYTTLHDFIEAKSLDDTVRKVV